MKTILAVALAGLILVCLSEAQAGKGGIEAEVGDVQGTEVGPDQNKAKQDETEKARLKALDEKLRKAEEEGNRPTAEGREAGSSVPTPTNTMDAKP